MFPRRKRLSRAEFPVALSGCRRISSANVSALIPMEGTGYAIIVSKKTAPLSVTRHRIKRRVLAALHTLPTLPTSLVLYPRASVLDIEYDALKQELIKLLS